ncbi:MAG: HDIG domain-containing protein [Clostridia bacterium]|nr:HDIG domain-containing protein [Clostridia bacterium]
MRRNIKHAIPIVMYVILYVFCVTMGVVSTMPETHAFEVGSVSDADIVASKDVVDEYSTNLLREEAKQKVAPIYDIHEEVTQQVEQDIIEVFSAFEQIRQKAQSLYVSANPMEVAPNFAAVNWEDFFKTNAAVLTDGVKIPEYITEQNLYTVASMSASQLEKLRQETVESTRNVLVGGLMEEEVAGAVEDIRAQFVENEDFSIEEASLAHNVVQNTLKANRQYNQFETEKAKEEAAAAVEEVTYKKGQNIVREGELISEAQLQLIKQLGLLDESSNRMTRWFSGASIMAAVFAAGVIFAITVDRSLYENKKIMMQIVTMTVLIVLVALVCRRIDQRVCPVFIVSILAAVVLERNTAIFYGVFASFVVAFVMAPQDAMFFDEQVLRQLTAGVLGSVTSVLLLKTKQKRSEYIIAGLAAGALSALMYMSYGVLNGFGLRDHFAAVCYALASGLVSGFMTVGILPIWETMFSVVTPSKLLELTDPSRPLLRKLMVEAPGTYHHSIMVANLAEAGAEAVGADALLTRVAAYYHDVGKLEDPLMFKENQINIPNPHDQMKPKESALIIRKHVRDGMRLVAQSGLPQKAIEIISQHHGDSVVGYFYYMAKQQGEVDEKDFRYPGKKPQTKEAGVLMMADITEAAIRAKKAASAPDLREQIAQLIKSKYDEGEFDECPLTRRDLNLIIDAFTAIFVGQRHERILYPQDKEKEANKGNA